MSTSAVTTTVLANTLFLSVPKLKASGLNWAIFSSCLQDAINAKGYWGNFDGMMLQPVITKPEDSPTTVTAGMTQTSATTTPSTEELAAVAQWDKDE